MRHEGKLVYAWYIVAVLLGASVLAYMDRLVVSFLIDPMKADLGMTDTQAGMLTGLAFSLFFVTMGLPLGRLIDTRPRHLVLAACVCLWSAMTMLSGVGSTFAWVFLARCGVGAGESAVNPAAVSIIGDSFPPDRVAWPISIYYLGLWGGGGLAIILGGQLVSYFMTLGTIMVPGLGEVGVWRLVLLCVGAPGVLVAGLIALTMRNIPRTHKVAPTASVSRQSLWAFIRREYGPLCLIIFGNASFGFASYNILSWYPAVIMRTYGVSHGQTSFLYGIPYLVAGIAGTLAAAPFIRWLRARGHADAPLLAAKICMMTAAIPTIAGPLMPQVYACVACLVVTIFCWGINTSAIMTTLVLATPRDMRGFTVSAYTIIMNVTGGTFGPMLVGALADHVFGAQHIGYGVSLTALAAFPSAILLFHLAQPRFRELLVRAAQSEAEAQVI